MTSLQPQENTQPVSSNILTDEGMFNLAVEIISSSRNRIVSSIYSESTKTYFELGKLIVEYEQDGEEKPQYGASTLKNLSKKLTARFGRGYSVSTLKDARQFYNTYKNRQNGSGVLDFKLGFSSYVLLTRVHENEREFYEALAIRDKMDYISLKHAVKTNVAIRMLNGDYTKLQSIISPKDLIKDPIIADFLGFDSFKEGDELKIEDAIIQNLEKFLLELGRGFAFVGRQYRINLSGSVFRADLVFYNIILKRYVIFEIKAREAQHKDIGQLQMYVNYFDRDICTETDNQTIGILLCKKKDQTIIDYTLPKDNETIFASELMLYLPTKEELLGILQNAEDKTETE